MEQSAGGLVTGKARGSIASIVWRHPVVMAESRTNRIQCVGIGTRGHWNQPPLPTTRPRAPRERRGGVCGCHGQTPCVGVSALLRSRVGNKAINIGVLRGPRAGIL